MSEDDAVYFEDVDEFIQYLYDDLCEKEDVSTAHERRTAALAVATWVDDNKEMLRERHGFDI